MRKFSLFLCTFFGSLFFFLGAQTHNVAVTRQLDSLHQLLQDAKADTTKIKLRYYIGLKAVIPRFSYWDSVIEDARRHHLPVFEQKACIQLGFNQLKKNMQVIGTQTMEKSIALAQKLGNKKATLSPLKYLASHYTVHNDFKRATYYCLRALKVAEELNDQKEIASTYSLLADIYFQTGDTKKALQLHLKCLPIFEHIGNKAETPWTLLSIGTDYDKLGDNATACDYYLKSLPYAGRFTDQLDEHIYNSAAAAYVFKKNYDSAYYYSGKSFEISRRSGDSMAIVSSMMTLAFLSFKKGDFKQAEILGSQALTLSKSLGFNAQIPQAAKLLKDIYLALKNYKPALEVYELYVTIKDSISNEESRKQLLEKEYTYTLNKKEDSNRLLTQQNQIQRLELRENKFTVIVLFILLGFILAVAYLLMRQNKLKANQQSAVLEHKLLRSQMNPHFIFNSLQAIQNFILKRDEKDAARYLSSFANITRNVLESSRMEAIPLSKEISLLSNYLQLQKLRFGTRFSYEITVDNAIDIEKLQIPPMLTQPFIENAVEHGTHAVKDDGLITVAYSIHDEHLWMEITDNGYGMSSARTGSEDHRSMALDITRERLALLNKKSKRKIYFEIGEAFPEHSERKGVKIRFSIPLVYTHD